MGFGHNCPPLPLWYLQDLKVPPPHDKVTTTRGELEVPGWQINQEQPKTPPEGVDTLMLNIARDFPFKLRQATLLWIPPDPPFTVISITSLLRPRGWTTSPTYTSSWSYSSPWPSRFMVQQKTYKDQFYSWSSDWSFFPSFKFKHFFQGCSSRCNQGIHWAFPDNLRHAG